MIDTSEAFGFALEDFGVEASIEWTTDTIHGLLSETSTAIDNEGYEVVTDKPTFSVSDTDASLVDDNSTVLVIAGVEYQIYKRGPAINGTVTLYLTRDF